MTAIPVSYVDWYCRKCGFEHQATTRSYSIPCKCPKCGEGRVSQGHPTLPVNQAWCDSSPRRYNLAGTNLEVQVYFRAATGEQCGITLDPDYVPNCDDDPINVARAVLEVWKAHYIGNSVERVENILRVMEACETLSETNRRANRVHELRKTLVLDLAEYIELTSPDNGEP